MGMILRIASSRIVGQGDIVGRSGYFSLNLSANSVMRGRLDARRTLKSLVADLRMINVGYKDKIFCGNSVSILKSFYFCICRSKLDYDYDRLYSYNFSYRRKAVWHI